MLLVEESLESRCGSARTANVPFCVPATIDLAGAEIMLVSMVAGAKNPVAPASRSWRTSTFDYTFFRGLPAVAGAAQPQQRARRSPPQR